MSRPPRTMPGEAGSMQRPTAYLFLTSILWLSATSALAAAAPVLVAFNASPASALPGQTVDLRLEASDPDCTAGSCTTGCGALIRPDTVIFSDTTGRTPTPFTGTVLGVSASPWVGTTKWLAPSVEGTYTINASVSDNGGMLCGGRKTAVFTLQVVVSSSTPPVIQSCAVDPAIVPAGGTATVRATATDPLARPLSYSFTAAAGTIAQASPQTPAAVWTAPQNAGSFVLRCHVEASGSRAVAQTTASVQIGAFLRRMDVLGLSVTRLAPLSDGRLVAVDGVNGILALLSSTGTMVWKQRGLGAPVAVAAAGNEIFVLERRTGRVSVWSTTGARVREFPVPVSLPNQLVAGPAAGELAISDTDAARVIVVSSLNGSLLRTIGSGLLKQPTGLAVSGGRIAVADGGAGRVHLFAENGALAKTLSATTFVRPQGVAWDATNTRLIVADSFTGELIVLGEEGIQRGALGGFGSEEGQLINPIDVSLLPGGVIVVPTGGGRLPLYQLVTTLAPLRPPVSVVAADRTGDDGGAVAISWNPSADDPSRVTGYRIERAAGQQDAFEVVGTVQRGLTTFVDASASSDVCHRYRVAATDGSSEAYSEATDCVVARNDQPPAQPQNVLAEAGGPFTVDVHWDSVTAVDLASYAIELSPGNVSKTVVPSATAVSLTGLMAGTEYVLSVRAVDTSGNQSLPATAAVKTWPDEAPTRPAGVMVSDAATSGEIRVSWTAPESSVPISKYRVTCTPSVNGWPLPSIETAATHVTVTGLVNTLPYAITVVAITPWERTSEPSSPLSVTPTAVPRELPVLAESDDIVDAAGLEVRFSVEAEKRELRFQYRATGTVLQPEIDGVALGSRLPDTGSAWVDAVVEVDKKLLKREAAHLFALRSEAFPDPVARFSVRRLDFVPLPPAMVRTEEFNSMVDIVWRWDEWRPDLGVRLTRDQADVLCRLPKGGRCRDPFLENGKKHTWTLVTTSPAGWVSAPEEVKTHARYEEGPPAVTDVTIAPSESGLLLDWTPVSASPAENSAAVAVRGYRIYAAGTLVTEVVAPPAAIGAFDPAVLVVRSVDTEGRESR